MSYELSDGEIRLWIEQEESLCLIARTEFGDPVELTSDEARALAKMLIVYADTIDSNDQ